MILICKTTQAIKLMNEYKSTRPNDSSPDSWNLLRKWMTERLDESHELNKGLIFGVCNFHEFIFLGLIFPDIYFFGYPKKCLGRAPLSCTCQSTLPGTSKHHRRQFKMLYSSVRGASLNCQLEGTVSQD